jgi:hypothetical protein
VGIVYHLHDASNYSFACDTHNLPDAFQPQFRQDPVFKMSDLYTSLSFSPRKKRCPPELGDETTFTPKKLRTACVF